MSILFSPIPVVSGLVRAEDVWGKNRQWNATNPRQTWFLNDFFARIRDEVVTLTDLKSIVTPDAEEAAEFLRKKGLAIQLNPFASEVGIATALTVLLDWRAQGSTERMPAYNRRLYDAIRLSGETVSYFTSGVYRYPIVKIETLAGHSVFLTIAQSVPTDEVTLPTQIDQIRGSLSQIEDFGDVVFPMVSLDEIVNIRWFLDMSTIAESGQIITITESKQQIMLQMNESGREKDDVLSTGEAIRVQKRDCVIDRPFLVWITSEHQSVPLLFGYITQDAWKAPRYGYSLSVYTLQQN